MKNIKLFSSRSSCHHLKLIIGEESKSNLSGVRLYRPRSECLLNVLNGNIICRIKILSRLSSMRNTDPLLLFLFLFLL